ncbi:methyltransferase domain-containing protein [Sorangium sp. So ce327]|jgi:SAM-dependent methyltransferase|uniref:methyltransferase domain-containing protein n=1 Tax=unclassified Sorangium TaxID=2621164 RepID=UPI003F614885
MSEREQYFLGYRRAEQERLQQQSEQLAHEADWLLDQIGLAAGARVLELGCGPRGCLDLLAARVGLAGSVVGVERSGEAVTLARKFIAQRGLRNVEVLEGDARATSLPKESFDLVTARLLLVNVPDPEQIVAEAVSLARPGGVVAFHEVDWAAMICDPPEHAWTTLIELFVRYTKRNGIDLFIGRKLPRLLRDAGLASVRIQPIVHVHPPGDARRPILLEFADNLRERILSQRLIAEQTFSDLREALMRHIENPETLVVHGPFFQVWGRKPR